MSAYGCLSFYAALRKKTQICLGCNPASSAPSDPECRRSIERKRIDEDSKVNFPLVVP